MLVGLVYNLKPPPDGNRGHVSSDRYAEWDSPKTIDALRAALSARHEVLLLDAREEAQRYLTATPPDFVFNIAEGTSGVHREAEIPRMLESLGIP